MKEYKEDLSQIHAPEELIEQTKQKMKQEEQRVKLEKQRKRKVWIPAVTAATILLVFIPTVYFVWSTRATTGEENTTPIYFEQKTTPEIKDLERNHTKDVEPTATPEKNM